MSTSTQDTAAAASPSPLSVETAVLLAGMITRAVTEPVPVRTVGLREGEQDRALLVHPLAAAIPGADREDLGRMWADIQANGVQVPVTLFQDRVLDGRHRLVIASLTGKTLPCISFRGDRDAARLFVWSANVARRHLSVPQLGTAALAHFEDAARAAAALAGPGRAPSAAIPLARQPEPWQRELSRMTGGAVSADTVKRLADSRVTEAPKTMAQISAGKIRRVQQAVTAAAAELGTRPPPPVPRSALDRLGCARGDVRAARATVLAEGPGAATRDQLLERVREVRDGLRLVEEALS